MASTQTIRQHDQNRVRPEDTQNAKHLVHGASAVCSRPPNTSSAFQREAENQDPSIRHGKGTIAGTSRLPVLARAQPLQPQNGFTNTHRKWEKSFQKGKAQKKKPCTKLVPFNLSQPRFSRVETASQQKTQPTNVGTTKLICSNASQPARPLPKHGSTVPPVTLPVTAPLTTLPVIAPHTALPVIAPLTTLPVTATHTALPVTAPLITLPVTAPQTTLPQADSSPVAVQSGHFGTASGQSSPPGAPSTSGFQSRHQEQVYATPQREACIRPATASTNMQFYPDPAALNSILQNEGVIAGGPLGATPRGSICPTGRGTSVYLPQRVSVLKSRPGPDVGAGGAVQFSPDPVALRTILQNEGLKAGGRGTSVYLPQRVPVTKEKYEATAVSTGTALSQTPALRWTPQRVRSTRPQSMRRCFSVHRTPQFLGSPVLRGLLGHGKEAGPHKEEPVVQKLFEEAEQEELMKAGLGEERVMNKQKDHPVSLQPESGLSLSVSKGGAEKGNDRLGKEESGCSWPSVPPPHRESVIVFSSAKNVVATATAQQIHPAPHPDSFLSLRPLPVPQPHGGIIQWVPHLLSGGLSYRRPPRLEECLLDEECAVYTSCPQTSPAHPRCANPVASLLLLQDPTGFIPIYSPPPFKPEDPQPVYCPVLLSA
ncbi:hypothetical protein AAFF_G00010950 [Aldrovandia affinis]|uniref:Uncharacterized protein n=1 Tax=Aldrovandia affinis TaxID=143900 RepID=A0AAD7S945_9TELE|nr:hypothetical protein AAFF_G00010950 [Aldrovandia affinis]